MSRLGPFLLGAFGTLLVLGVGAFAGVCSGLIPANADAAPSGLERWAARTSLKATIERRAPKGDAPIPGDAKNLDAGLAVYANDCAVCHGYADGKRSHIAAGLYQRPPQLGAHGVEDDPVGETYWKVEHGIRLTGMPAFTHALTKDQLWQVSLFLKQMDKLPPGVDARWKALRAPQPAQP